MSHLEGGICWCNPVFFTECNECEGAETVDPCWKCTGAGVIRGAYVAGCVEIHWDIVGEPDGTGATVTMTTMGGPSVGR